MKYMLSDKNYLLNYIQARLMKRNQNFLACVTGPTGSGKSYDALTLAEAFSKNNNIDFTMKQVVFTAKELMALINSGTLPKGSVIIFEEAGVAYNNREWQSLVNKSLNYLMQTFRHRNYFVIYTVPDFSFVDVAARKLFHCRFETKRIDYIRGLAYVKPLFLTVDQATGKQYAKFFRIPIVGKLNYGLLKRVAFRLPSAKIIKLYEKRKGEYTEQLNKDIQENIETESKVKNPLTNNQAVFIHLKTKLGMSRVQIANSLGWSNQQAYSTEKTLRSRGYLDEQVLNNLH